MEYEYVGVVVVNDDDIYIMRNEDTLYAGIMTNAGFVAMDEIIIDDSCSVDDCIAKLVERI